MNELKIVFFDVYCNTCKHKDISEHDSPCDECLYAVTRENSHKPIKYEEKENI